MSSAWNIHQMNLVLDLRESLAEAAPALPYIDPKQEAADLKAREAALKAAGKSVGEYFNLRQFREAVEAAEKESPDTQEQHDGQQ